MSKYTLALCLAVIVLAVACSDNGNKPTEPAVVVPSISIGDYTVVEGGTALFPVTLDKTTTRAVTFSYETIAGTATAGVDFVAASGSDTIAAGQTSATILVVTIDDSDLESAETFSVALSAVLGASVADGLATGTINDNETGVVSYASRVAPLLDSACALPGICHGPSSTHGGGLYIDAGASYSVVINAIGTYTGGKVVVPDSASKSSLYFVTTSNPQAPFSRMPTRYGLDSLSTSQQNLLRDWINQGALDN
jgi:hypothetical protein